MNTEQELHQAMSDKGVGKATAVLDAPTKNVQAVYKYRKQVFCINQGWDSPFADLAPEEQAQVKAAIDADKFIKSNTFQ